MFKKNCVTISKNSVKQTVFINTINIFKYLLFVLIVHMPVIFKNFVMTIKNFCSTIFNEMLLKNMENGIKTKGVHQINYYVVVFLFPLIFICMFADNNNNNSKSKEKKTKLCR